MFSTPVFEEKLKKYYTTSYTAVPSLGATLRVPGEIFKVADTEYTAIIKGWNGRKTDSIIARFDDGSQYWFPLEDALSWMSKQPGSADPPTPFTMGPPSSPGSTVKKAAALRHRAASAAAASSRNNAEAADKQSGLAGHRLQLEVDDEQQRTLPHHAAGVVCAVVLLLVVMLVAITTSKGAAHELEAWVDGMSELYSGMKARFAVRQSDWSSGQSQQVVLTTTAVGAQETAAEVWK